MDEVEEGGLNFTELRFFLAGATQVELTKPNPEKYGKMPEKPGVKLAKLLAIAMAPKL